MWGISVPTDNIYPDIPALTHFFDLAKALEIGMGVSVFDVLLFPGIIHIVTGRRLKEAVHLPATLWPRPMNVAQWLTLSLNCLICFFFFLTFHRLFICAETKGFYLEKRSKR
jgi:hypothetical protein